MGDFVYVCVAIFILGRIAERAPFSFRIQLYSCGWSHLKTIPAYQMCVSIIRRLLFWGICIYFVLISI